jgi:hypothetical protein
VISNAQLRLGHVTGFHGSGRQSGDPNCPDSCPLGEHNAAQFGFALDGSRR